MPRPMRFRRVSFEPTINYFKPAGVRMRLLEDVTLAVDELEAVRLKDYEGKDQTEAAKSMDVSQPTFQRIYESARKKIADVLINGKALRIEGGNYRFIDHRRMHRHGGGAFYDRRA